MKKLILMLIMGLMLVNLVNAVPTEFTYVGTKYVNCHLSEDFPVDLTEETTLTGKIEKPMVSRRDPLLNGVVIDKNALYNPITKTPFNSYDDFRPAIGEKITVKGYIEGVTGEYNIFYVTNVVDWQYICCDATLEDTGEVSTPNVCFWFSIKDFETQVEESNYLPKPELKQETPNFIIRMLSWFKGLFS